MLDRKASEVRTSLRAGQTAEYWSDRATKDRPDAKGFGPDDTRHLERLTLYGCPGTVRQFR
jgi:hypothetical protein